MASLLAGELSANGRRQPPGWSVTGSGRARRGGAHAPPLAARRAMLEPRFLKCRVVGRRRHDLALGLGLELRRVGGARGDAEAAAEALVAQHGGGAVDLGEGLDLATLEEVSKLVVHVLELRLVNADDERRQPEPRLTCAFVEPHEAALDHRHQALAKLTDWHVHPLRDRADGLHAPSELGRQGGFVGREDPLQEVDLDVRLRPREAVGQPIKGVGQLVERATCEGAVHLLIFLLYSPPHHPRAAATATGPHP